MIKVMGNENGGILYLSSLGWDLWMLFFCYHQLHQFKRLHGILTIILRHYVELWTESCGHCWNYWMEYCIVINFIFHDDRRPLKAGFLVVGIKIIAMWAWVRRNGWILNCGTLQRVVLKYWSHAVTKLPQLIWERMRYCLSLLCFVSSYPDKWYAICIVFIHANECFSVLHCYFVFSHYKSGGKNVGMQWSSLTFSYFL